MELTAFPKIFTIGQPETQGLFDGPVEITEKLDGSQFVFGKRNGELKLRSKGAIIQVGAPPKLFQPAHDYVLSIADRVPDNFCFWGETLSTPRHNILAYERVPLNNITLFGAQDLVKGTHYATFGLAGFAKDLGVDVVPTLFAGNLLDWLEAISRFMETESYLGGQRVEGLVVKNYTKGFYRGNIMFPILCGKIVSEAFKEKHKKEWVGEKTGNGRYQVFLSQFASAPRWHKAIQRMKEAETLTQSPKDIGPLIKSIQTDVLEEEREDIKESLYKIFHDDVARASIRGFPKFYKDLLLQQQAGDDNTPQDNSTPQAA